MSNYSDALDKLNPSQLKAVQTTDGPLMVLAGPGTGKTQLLTTRIAYILENSDTLAENILCLTYTDSATETMRQRLFSLIGTDAYRVNIMTYHSFGASIIRDNTFYFDDFLAFEPIDNLNTIELIKNIQENLPYSNLVKNKNYLNRIIGLINSLKNNLISPDDLRLIIKNDLKFIDFINIHIELESDNLQKINKNSIKSFKVLYDKSFDYESKIKLKEFTLNNLANSFNSDLTRTIEQFNETNSTKPLTRFKYDWLKKNSQNMFNIKWANQYKQLISAVEVFEKYNQDLRNRQMIDYSDMIIEVIDKLESDLELKCSIQEKYQYIMIDEFQDSNEAQFHLAQLLVDNPVHEGRPNIMIVGDDNQAIFSFQGADYSHMVKFFKAYRDVEVISLSENYRSSQKIIDLFGKIADKISDKLVDEIPVKRDRLFQSKNSKIPSSIINRINFKNETTEFEEIIQISKDSIDKGQTIAVIAPKHKYLENLLPYLKANSVPIIYERRDDILKDPYLLQIITIARLISRLSNPSNNSSDEDHLWSRIISFPFLNLSTEFIANLSLQSYQQKLSWNQILLKNKTVKLFAEFINSLAQKSEFYSADEIMDFLIGSKIYNETRYTSSFFEFYFGQYSDFKGFYLLMDNLYVLRNKFRQYQKTRHQILSIHDFVGFIDLNIDNEQIILSSDITSSNELKLELLTGHKAKGREFDNVILLNVNEETWNDKKGNNQNSFSLPPTLNLLQYQTDNINEKLRLFYVALSRAKKNLFLLNSQIDLNSSNTTPLSFLDEEIKNSRLFSPLIDTTGVDVEISDKSSNLSKMSALSYSWHQRHLDELSNIQFKSYVQNILTNFALTPTNLNSYLNLVNEGPDKFFLSHVLRFPRAQSPAVAYGNAIHNTLEWISNTLSENNSFNDIDKIVNRFKTNLSNQTLPKRLIKDLEARGENSLSVFFKEKRSWLTQPSINEYSLNNKGIVLNQDIRLKGKIDRINLNEKSKSIQIIDYKTSKPVSSWTEDASKLLHQHQLYFYQLLLKNSTQFKDYQIESMSIIFVDPSDDGQIKELKLFNDPVELDNLKTLIVAVWDEIMSLNFSKPIYKPTVAGIKQFENYLINKNTTL